MRRGTLSSSVVATVLTILYFGYPAGPAQASGTPGLSISVPSSAALGTGAPAGRLSATVGPVTVTTTGIVGSSEAWTATVSATAFTTGGGSAPETIPLSAVTYWSGPATSSSGVALTACSPGQLSAPQAVDLSTPRTAYSCTGVSLLAGTSLTWNPTLTVTPGASALAGPYHAVITQSVA